MRKAIRMKNLTREELHSVKKSPVIKGIVPPIMNFARPEFVDPAKEIPAID